MLPRGVPSVSSERLRVGPWEAHTSHRAPESHQKWNALQRLGVEAQEAPGLPGPRKASGVDMPGEGALMVRTTSMPRGSGRDILNKKISERLFQKRKLKLETPGFCFQRGNISVCD